MTNTNHALKRFQQRGIKNSLVEIILEYGVSTRRPGDAFAYMIPKKEKNKIISNLKHIINVIDKSSGRVLIVSSDGHVITGYHKK